MSLYYEPYYLRSVLEPLFWGPCFLKLSHRSPLSQAKVYMTADTALLESDFPQVHHRALELLRQDGLRAADPAPRSVRTMDARALL